MCLVTFVNNVATCVWVCATLLRQLKNLSIWVIVVVIVVVIVIVIVVVVVASTRITVAFIPAVFLEYAERALLFRRTVLSYCSYLLSWLFASFPPNPRRQSYDRSFSVSGAEYREEEKNRRIKRNRWVSAYPAVSSIRYVQRTDIPIDSFEFVDSLRRVSHAAYSRKSFVESHLPLYYVFSSIETVLANDPTLSASILII